MPYLKRLAAAVLCSVLAGAAGASPFQMPDMHAATNYEIKVQAQYTKARDGKTVEGPALDITAPLRPGLETSVTFGRGRISGETWGNLDTELAVKWEAIPIGEEDGHVGITVEPAVILPTGNRGLGADEHQLAVPIIAGANWGAFGLRGLLGYQHGFKSNDNAVQFGALATYEVTDRFSVGLEYAGESSTRRPHDYESSADVGFTFALTPKVELQGRVGHTLHAPSNASATQLALFLEFAL
jgi:hypothetical protein